MNDDDDYSLLSDNEKSISKLKSIKVKDPEKRKEQLSFTAYSHHLETSCKFLTYKRNVNLCEQNDKPRLFVSATGYMHVTPTAVTRAASSDICI